MQRRIVLLAIIEPAFQLDRGTHKETSHTLAASSSSCARDAHLLCVHCPSSADAEQGDHESTQTLLPVAGALWSQEGTKQQTLVCARTNTRLCAFFLIPPLYCILMGYTIKSSLGNWILDKCITLFNKCSLLNAGCSASGDSKWVITYLDAAHTLEPVCVAYTLVRSCRPVRRLLECHVVVYVV